MEPTLIQGGCRTIQYNRTAPVCQLMKLFSWQFTHDIRVAARSAVSATHVVPRIRILAYADYPLPHPCRVATPE